MSTPKQERSMSNRTEHEQQAYDMGRAAAIAAASWVIDGNTPQEHIARLLAMLDDGDPEAYDYLPREPNLSGEYADGLTPQALALDILGPVDDTQEMCDPYAIREQEAEALADAYEEGVSDHFAQECERILRAAKS